VAVERVREGQKGEVPGGGSERGERGSDPPPSELKQRLSALRKRRWLHSRQQPLAEGSRGTPQWKCSEKAPRVQLPTRRLSLDSSHSPFARHPRTCPWPLEPPRRPLSPCASNLGGSDGPRMGS